MDTATGLPETTTADKQQKVRQIMQTIVLAPGESVTITAAVEAEQPPDRRTVLPVPWLGQWSQTARRAPGDCGPASIAMAVHYFTDQEPTVDEVSQACGVAPGARWASLTKCAKGARAYGLKATHVRPLTQSRIEDEIRASRPVIALIKYGKLLDNQDPFNGNHFILIIGIDVSTVIIHDPDRLSGSTFGEFRELQWTNFLHALGSTSKSPGTAYNNHGILLDVR